MESVLVGLILLSFSGFWCWQPPSAPPPSGVLVRVGENATLRCPLLDAADAAPTCSRNMTVSWYRKWEGQSPQLLLSFRSIAASNVKYGAGVGPEKVSAAADGSLLLHDSTQNDSAVYYCSITQGDERGEKPTPRGDTGQ